MNANDKGGMSFKSFPATSWNRFETITVELRAQDQNREDSDNFDVTQLRWLAEASRHGH
jgi:hypothetical protein